jgi:hypothetical protein
MTGTLLLGLRHDMRECGEKSTGGEVANALVCKTSIHGFKSHPVLQLYQQLRAWFSNAE